MNSNKQQIQKLRDCAELAQASYGHFHLANNKFSEKIQTKINRTENPIITYEDILNKEYEQYEAITINELNQEESIGTLKGDFTPTQAKRFFERYTLIEHIPDDKIRHIPYDKRGFSATIFYDKLNANYIILFRGTNAYKNI